jgi:hypothetical protein
MTLQRVFPAGGVFYLGVHDPKAGTLPDGGYTYELRLSPALSPEAKDWIKAAQNSPDRAQVSEHLREQGLLPVESMVQSGGFQVAGGQLIVPSETEEPTSPWPSRSAGTLANLEATPLDQVIADDLIVQGSLCVGFDCVNGESFGFDTVRLKENNLRIKFEDTSNTASFPTNDWQITVNDSANGGANYFAIDDIDGGRTPFKIIAGAPTNSLYVDNSGNIGRKTSNPVMELHLADGDTPGVRLDQDGSGGWGVYVWDVAANETNFFVRDVTGGSTLPFRIRPGAPSNTLYLGSDGKVGSGTTSPEAALHVRKEVIPLFIVEHPTGNARMDFRRGSPTGVSQLLYGTGTVMEYQMGMFLDSNFQLRVVNDGTRGITLTPAGLVGIGTTAPAYPLHMASGARCTVGGNWQNASSRDLKDNIEALSASEALKALDGLTPVKFTYRADAAERHVGFVAEDVPDLVASQDRKGMSPMDVVAVLTKVIQEQQRVAAEQERAVSALSEKVQALEAELKSRQGTVK